MTIGVRSPRARFHRCAWLPNVAVGGRLEPGAEWLEARVENRIRFARTSRRLIWLSRRRFSNAFPRGGVGPLFFFTHRFFACVEFSLTLCEALLFLRLVFGGEARLDFAFDVSIAFRFSLLLLATGQSESTGRDDNDKSVHGIVRL